MDGRRFIVEHLSTIDRVVHAVARRRGFDDHAEQEFRAVVRLRLVEDDYAILRAFDHRSSLATYLGVVIARIALAERNREWGRWRPSAEAERRGPVAVLLDRLTSRDGHSLDEAIHILATNHQVPLTEAELRELWTRLPYRAPTTRVTDAAALGVPDPHDALAGVSLPSEAERRAVMGAVVQRALAGVSDEDRTMLALHYRHDVSLSRLAQQFRAQRSTVHYRLTAVLKRLRSALEAHGFSGDAVRDALSSGWTGLTDVVTPAGEPPDDPGESGG